MDYDRNNVEIIIILSLMLAAYFSVANCATNLATIKYIFQINVFSSILE